MVQDPPSVDLGFLSRFLLLLFPQLWPKGFDNQWIIKFYIYCFISLQLLESINLNQALVLLHNGQLWWFFPFIPTNLNIKIIILSWAWNNLYFKLKAELWYLCSWHYQSLRKTVFCDFSIQSPPPYHLSASTVGARWANYSLSLSALQCRYPKNSVLVINI